MDQLIYARWLAIGSRVALLLLVATFAAYALGLVPPLVAPAALAEAWRLPVRDFMAATGAPSGWGWLALLGKGDYLNMVGVALLGAVSLVCYLRILVHYVRKGETALAWLAVAQVLVLAAAASGLAAGMH
jgi:hypothetical protein